MRECWTRRLFLYLVQTRHLDSFENKWHWVVRTVDVYICPFMVTWPFLSRYATISLLADKNSPFLFVAAMEVNFSSGLPGQIFMCESPDSSRAADVLFRTEGCSARTGLSCGRQWPWTWICQVQSFLITREQLIAGEEFCDSCWCEIWWNDNEHSWEESLIQLVGNTTFCLISSIGLISPSLSYNYIHYNFRSVFGTLILATFLYKWTLWILPIRALLLFPFPVLLLFPQPVDIYV